jgi:hypothetical protein
MQLDNVSINLFKKCNKRALAADKTYLIHIGDTELFHGSYYGRTFTNCAIFHGCKFYNMDENQEIVPSDCLDATEIIVPLDKFVAYRTK